MGGGGAQASQEPAIGDMIIEGAVTERKEVGRSVSFFSVNPDLQVILYGKWCQSRLLYTLDPSWIEQTRRATF